VRTGGGSRGLELRGRRVGGRGRSGDLVRVAGRWSASLGKARGQGSLVRWVWRISTASHWCDHVGYRRRLESHLLASRRRWL